MSDGGVSSEQPAYLRPYVSAAQRHGGGFGSLLWASRRTQTTRFDALARAADFRGRSVLDVGCGRADLLDFLIERGLTPEHYVGLEAVAELAEAAEAKRHPNAMIVRADFVAEPRRLFVGADVVAFSGSLNTLDDGAFYRTLRAAYDATAGDLVFNFLSSKLLAGTRYLYWRAKAEVKRFLSELGGEVKVVDGYIDGDCTMRVRKPEE